MPSFHEAAAGAAPARLKQLLADELTRCARELQKPRSGYDEPVTVAFAPDGVAALPAPAAVRA
ncbi:MAG: hypothetical protein M3389_13850, partial [Actinomycetota bacterium]|nr:hypothetical protein [Actinomycetota bacterium]